MVGPDAEATGMVRRGTHVLATFAQFRPPIVAVVVRKAFGLGAMAMAGGSLHVPFLTLAWPLAEFGAMGLEGAVLLALRPQLEAVADPQERNQMVATAVEQLRASGHALNAAAHVEVDNVIDPAATRSLLAHALRAAVSEKSGRIGIFKSQTSASAAEPLAKAKL